MRSRSRARFVLTVVVASVLWPLPARAERTQSDLVIVRVDDVVDEDLYAAANAIRIEGRVEGDLYAVAFNEVLISGTVTGDVVALAGRVEVTGEVGGSLRAVSPTMIVTGSVADDVLGLAWATTLAREAEVGRDFLNWSVRAAVEGAVGRHLEGQSRSLSLAGSVGDTVDVVVRRLTVAGTARIGGDLVYQSAEEAVVGDDQVEGNVIRRTSLPPNVRLRGLRLLTYLLAFLTIAALGLLTSWARPSRVEAAVRSARDLSASWLTGFLVVLSPLLLTALLAVLVVLSPAQAGVPLALVLAPLVVGLGGVALLLLLLGVVPVAGLVGRSLLKRASTAAAVLAGWLILALALPLPVVGPVVGIAAFPLGIGAWLRHGRYLVGHETLRP